MAQLRVMVLQVPLRHLTLLLDEDISSLPQPALIARLKALFGFLGELSEVELRDDIVRLHLQEPVPSNSAESAKLAERAAKRAREGDYPRAVELLRHALQLSPTRPTLHRDLAMSLMELGQHAEAKDALIDALKLDATDAWSFVVLGNLYAKHEANFPQARRFLERALELKPGDAWALNGLAAALIESGDSASALQRFEEAIRNNPDFANAWLGKAMLQLRRAQPLESANTIKEMFAKAKVQDARSEPVFAEASKVFLTAETELARLGESEAFKAVETYRRTVELESGFPVEVSEDSLPAQTAGRAQIAWKHRRDRHLITSRLGLPPPISRHIVAHELTHIRLEAEARRVGRNRFFVTTAATREQAIRSIGPDIRRLEKQQYRADAIERVVLQLVDGICSQLFNCPLDMLIERQLDNELPALRSAQVISLAQLTGEAQASTFNPEVRRLTPSRILRASSALNGAYALLVDELTGGTLRCWPAYCKLETAKISQKLWQHWQQRYPTLTPGGEYNLVDEFADIVGLRDWYVWKPDPGEQSPPTADDVEPVREGTTNPDLLRAKHPAAVWFLLDALQRYSRISTEEVRKITFETAMIGREGLDYANPDKKYILKSLPGETFSGLQMMCLMHAGLKRIAPEQDTGMDLEEPFLTALGLFNTQSENL